MRSHYTFFKKSIAIFLAALCFCIASLSFFGIYYAAENKFYTSTKSQLRHDAIMSLLAAETDELYERYLDKGDPIGYYEGTNFGFEIFDEKGNLILGNYANEEIGESLTTTPDQSLGSYTINAYMLIEGTDLFKIPLGFVNFVFATRFFLIGLFIAFVIALLALSVYLIYAAGRHPGETDPRCGTVERIPFDIYILIHAALTVTGIFILDLLQYAVSDVLLFMVVIAMIGGAYLLTLAFGMSLAVRIKTKTLWKNTLFCIIFAFLFKKTRVLLRLIPLIWKTVIFMVVYIPLEIIGLSVFWDKAIMFALIKNLILLPFVLYLVYSFRSIQKGAEEIEKGGLDKRIDTENMVGEFKAFGETLNHIGDGLTKAVEERIRSERMKTELITNVSHDIKTPLTSIINYADLLKKEKIENENAIEYIHVIDRQASRLKKLITDLVEASKASTGNIQVNFETCDVSVLLQQAAGEYDEKFRVAALTPILRLPEESVCITADGRLLWRVFDNLMGNICKYSLPGTRVYMNADAYGDLCIISFKNISRTELNVSASELVERFVRADSSRSTEGNGLGLSIAQSLVELQGGKLEIIADGDLFKVNLQFPIQKTAV